MGAQRILIDITTFTHEILLILFRVCNAEFHESSVIDFFYAPASEYSIGDEPSEKWLSKGISEVRSVMGYPGVFAPSKGTHLIVLAGFEDYRALSLIQELEPSLVSIGYGDRSEDGTQPHQVTNESKVARIRSLVGDVDDFVFSCYDALIAEQTIQEVVGRNAAYNTILAPMNTKISTLGAGRVALKDESIERIRFATPKRTFTTTYAILSQETDTTIIDLMTILHVSDFLVRRQCNFDRSSVLRHRLEVGKWGSGRPPRSCSR